MASIRKTKKEVEYLTGEVISNCYLAVYFQPEDSKDDLIRVITQSVEFHNDMIERINKPAQKSNLKKYYRDLREEMFTKIDALFASISDICKSDKPKK